MAQTKVIAECFRKKNVKHSKFNPHHHPTSLHIRDVSINMFPVQADDGRVDTNPC